jgi:hypothetical protein
MPFFSKRVDYNDAKSASPGETIEFELTREFHIVNILLATTVTNDASALTANMRGGDLIKNVSIVVSDGTNTREVVSASGGDLIEYARQISGLDKITLQGHYTPTTTASANWYLNIPIWFAHPQMADPLRSFFLLPAPRFNSNIRLRVRLEDGSAFGTNPPSTISVRPIVTRRVVTIEDFVTWDTELLTTEQAYTSSGARQRFELPVPGSYTGILLRTWDSDGNRLDPSTSDGVFSLQALQTTFQRIHLSDLNAINGRSADFAVDGSGGANYPGFFANDGDIGEYYMDFLSDERGSSVNELTSLLDANIYAATGAKLELLQDIAGSANAKIRYLTHRIFGDIERFKGIR